MLCYSTQHIKKLKNISMEIFQQVPKKISMKTFFFCKQSKFCFKILLQFSYGKVNFEKIRPKILYSSYFSVKILQ